MAVLKKIVSQYSLSILSGIFIGTSYIPFPPWAALFCFVPLWLNWLNIHDQNLSLKESAKEIFISGWITQFILTLIGFNWVTYTVYEFGHLPWILSFLVMLLFSAVAHLYIPLAGLCWLFVIKKIQLNNTAKMALLPVITSFFEPRVLTLFPWNFGYTWMWIHAPIFQIAEVIGFQGLSSLIIFFNFGILYTFKKWRQDHLSAQSIALALVVVFLILNLFGYVLKKQVAAPDSSVKVALIQANIGNLEKERNMDSLYFQERIFAKHENLSLKARAKSEGPLDVTIWPETAYPYQLFENIKNIPYQQLEQLAQNIQGNLITGSYGLSNSDKKLTNAFYIVDAQGVIQSAPYYKTILLAFGEYIPGGDLFPQIKNWIPAGDFSRGPGPQVKYLDSIQTPGAKIKIGPQICYESLFSPFTVELANKGADLIVNLTNDSWYGPWQEPYQHLYMTLARGIEVRRPVIRSTNTGISTVSLADGTILEKSPLDKPWFGIYEIPYKKDAPPTFYQKFPWLMDALIIMTCILLFAFGRIKIVRTSQSGLARHN